MSIDAHVYVCVWVDVVRVCVCVLMCATVHVCVSTVKQAGTTNRR